MSAPRKVPLEASSAREWIENLSARLPSIAPEEALERNAIYAALDGLALVDGDKVGRLAVTFGAPVETRPSLVFATSHGPVGLIAEVIGTRQVAWPAALDPTRTAELAAMLQSLEDLVQRLEDSLQTPFVPQGIGELSRHRFRLAVADTSGATDLRISVSSERSLAGGWGARSRPRALTSVLPALRGRGQIQFAGPLAPRGELGLLEPGDLVLLPPLQTGWPAQLTTFDGRPLALGRFAPRPCRFEITTPSPRRPLMPSATIPEGQHPGGREPETGPEMGGDGRLERAPVPEAWTEATAEMLPVRLKVICGEITVSLRQLADLGPGCVLDLESADLLRVELRAEDLTVAEGQLVALGDGYGVLVEQVQVR